MIIKNNYELIKKISAEIMFSQYKNANYIKHAENISQFAVNLIGEPQYYDT